MSIDSSNRKSLAFASAVGLIAAYAYYASGLPKYEYHTDIFVGEFAKDEGFQPVELAATIEIFVHDTLLLAPTTEELRELGVSDVRSSALVTVVEAGKSLRIRSTAAEGDIARVKAVHQFVADGILNRLKRRATYVKTRLERRLAEAQEKLKFDSDNLAVFSEIVSNAKEFEAKTRELARRLADEISELDRSQQGSSPPVAQTATDELRNEGVRLSKLSQLGMYQKLSFADIPLLRAVSAKSIVDLEQSAAQSRQVIKDLNEQLAVFREPAVTQFTLRSASSVGPSRLLTLLVGLVAGFTTYFAARVIQRALWST